MAANPARSPLRLIAGFVATAAAACCIAVAAPAARAATPDQVKTAITNAKNYIYSKQNKDGSWDDPQPPAVKGHAQWGGQTAVATYALLAGGESYQDPRVAKAIDWLAKADKMQGIYALGLRSQVWTYLPDSKLRRELFKRDFDLYMKATDQYGRFSYMADKSDKFYHNSTSQYGVLGMWAIARSGGEVPSKFWQACENGWKLCQGEDGGWTYKSIRPGPGDESRATMTAAGIASLFITQDYLHGNDGLRCSGNITNPNIEAGLNWMSRNYNPNETNGYLLYGIERIGVASGRKYFGNRDWYQAGADALLRTQSKAGAWNYHSDVVGTGFGILFLARGSAPVAMNKLEYTVTGTRGRDKGKEILAKWNQRPRDVANVVDWIGDNLERDLNWQVTSLAAATADDLQDAPILYMSGEDDLEFAAEQKAKLRQFVIDGGLLLGNPDCGDKKFAASFKTLAAELFPGYAFRVLPDTHVILKEQQFNAANWKRKPEVEALGNGVRELAILLPDEDAGRSWQTRSDATKREHFELGADIFLYAVEKQSLRSKGETHIVKRDDKVKPNRTVRLARLMHAGNANPEPGGWTRMTNLLHNTQKLTLQVEQVAVGPMSPAAPAEPQNGKPEGPAKKGAAAGPRAGVTTTEPSLARAVAVNAAPDPAAQAQQPPAKPAPPTTPAATKPAGTQPAATQPYEPPIPPVPTATAGGALAGFTVAHLTGTDDFMLTDQAKQDLKAFVESGGTLIVDAAGGSTRFVEAAERQLTEALGTATEQLRGEPIPADADVYKLWRHPIAQFAYRRYARDHGVGRTTAPRVRSMKVGERMAVFFSREDLSAGILGQPVDGVIGYTPETATDIVTNVILYAAGEVREKPKPPATAPATAPTAKPVAAPAPATPAPAPAAK